MKPYDLHQTLSGLIQNIVDSSLPRFSEDKVLIFGFSRQEQIGEGADVDFISKHFQLHIYRPNNFTKVVVFEKNRIEMFYYHDSCWRTDGVDRALRYINPSSVESVNGSLTGPCFKVIEDIPQEGLEIYKDLTYDNRIMTGVEYGCQDNNTSNNT